MPATSPLDWLQTRHRSCRRWVILTILLGTAAGGGIIVQAGLLSYIIHAAFIDATPRTALLPFFTVLIAVIGLRALLTWGREICGQKASTRIRRDLRRQLLEQVQQLGPIYAQDQQTAPLTSTLIERVESLHGYVAHYLPQKTLALIVPTMIGLTAFSFSWVVGLIFLLTAPLIPLFMMMIGRGADKLNQQHFQQLSRMSAHFLDTLQGLATLKLFHRSQQETARIKTSSENYRKTTMAVLRVAFLSSAVLEFLTSVAIAMTAVFLGLSYLHYLDFGLYSRELTLQTGLFLLLLAPEFYQPLRELGTHYHARAEALGAAAEISRILAESPPVPTLATTTHCPAPPFSLVLKNVSFHFDQGRRPALQNLCLEVGAGEWLAVVGTSGAGKTTLLNLLLRFLPLQQGEILVNSYPLDQIARAEWHRQIAWVPQQAMLFCGTLADNIAMGNPQVSPDQINTAARAVRLGDPAAGLDAGLSTLVGEQGNRLSGGQARRLALARAFARNAPLLLLDEPTAGLDPENERAIIDQLKQLTQGKTVIMLTHRLDTARAADRIAVMADGAIIEQGGHNELLAQNGAYAGLIHSSRKAFV